ncbi:MAG: N-acetyltransferase [Acidobacteria bacterium]|nr:N-acetyltransferase [Acidobacteriota bacterium]
MSSPANDPPRAAGAMATTRSENAFVLEQDGQHIGRLDYRVENSVLYIDYVEVIPSQRGKGLGVPLIDAATDWARDNALRVVPLCGYARSVMVRDARYADVFKGR